MNEYTLDDLVKLHGSGVGHHEYFVEISDEMLAIYSKLFDRMSPLHTDDDYARAQGFKSRIVPQLLVVSLVLPMGEEHLPGKYGLGLGANDLIFRNPAYVGDRLRFRGEIVKISRAARLIVLGIHVTNQSDLPILECQWKIRVLK